MQHLDNDMDDLFQRAAEEYPLNIGKGEWESIAKRITPENGTAEVIAPPKNKRNIKIILFSLFLLMLFMGSLIIYQPVTEISSVAKVVKVTYGPNNRLNSKAITSNNITINGEEEKAFYILNRKNKQGQYKKRSGTNSSYSSTKITISSASLYSDNTVEPFNNKEYRINTEEDNGDHPDFFYPDNNFIYKPAKVAADNLMFNREVISIQRITGKVLLGDLLTVDNNMGNTKSKKKEAAALPNNKKGYYIGLVSGLDFSKVQSGPFNNTGFDAGLLAGWKLKPKLYFESGMIWSKKKYLSQGKNFNMDKVGNTMAPGMIINNLESQSTLIEIPLKIKYDFIGKRNSILFVSAGVSSYIMTMEKNYYNVTLNGNTDKLMGVYKKNNYRLPAVANISIGYQQHLHKNFDIRIEPFLKIPLQGIGTGSLRVTSAGLQAGIISRLH